VLFQWGVAVTVFILLNRFITRRFVVEDNDD